MLRIIPAVFVLCFVAGMEVGGSGIRAAGLPIMRAEEENRPPTQAAAPLAATDETAAVPAFEIAAGALFEVAGAIDSITDVASEPMSLVPDYDVVPAVVEPAADYEFTLSLFELHPLRHQAVLSALEEPRIAVTFARQQSLIARAAEAREAAAAAALFVPPPTRETYPSSLTVAESDKNLYKVAERLGIPADLREAWYEEVVRMNYLDVRGMYPGSIIRLPPFAWLEARLH